MKKADKSFLSILSLRVRQGFGFSSAPIQYRNSVMINPINDRKLDHIRIVSEKTDVDRCKAWFDRIHLTHRALPELDLAQVDPSTKFMGKRLAFPLLISSMTGGADDELLKINRNLAKAAEAEGVALAVGSQRVLLENDEARASFELRQHAPTTVLLGNLGAVQLNYELGRPDCEQVLDVLGADGLYLHLNPLQEAVQPEGDGNFSNLRSKIAVLNQSLDKPLLVKEVGAGISPVDVEHLLDAGVRYIDLAGSGGTSWSMVENHRSETPGLGELFADWGVPTPLALHLAKPWMNKATFIASGGVRNGIDMAKSLVLGASMCGVACPFLNPARESVGAVRQVIRRFKREFVTAMFLLGCANVEELKGNEGVILNENWHR